MKNLSVLVLGLSLVTSVSHASGALSVSMKEITAKTNLVGVTNASVNGVKSDILTDSAAISVYTFDLDSNNKSVCTGACLHEWPPVHVPAGSKVALPFGVIKGGDGLPQLTLKGQALYHYDDDKKVGDVFGQYPKWRTVTVRK